MTPALLRLPAWQHRLLIVVSALLLLSGGAWLGLHYSVGAGRGDMPHPLEHGLMEWHGAAGFGALFAFGMLAAGHVPAGWKLTRRRRGPQRLTGLALLALAGCLVGSAYGLYYLVGETWRPALGWAHSGAGLLMLAFALVHRRAGADRRRSVAPGAPDQGRH
jgi:hypothetical protein